jgi:succinate dehydrogenase / fumarate reductase cytochrome b subunit
MAGFFYSSIGRKLIMSLTGLFLMIFLLVHLTVNSMLLVDDGTTFNKAAHFMATNPLVRVVEPLLAIGFIAHIILSIFITLENQKARPTRYKLVGASENSTWASRNMFILGGLIFTFLAIHLANFFWKMRFGDVPEILIEDVLMQDAYTLVAGLFIKYWWYDLIYVLGGIFLGLHLTHGFWSAFQTLGWNNDAWLRRIQRAGYVYAIIVAGGFIAIPVYFFVTSNF